MVTVSSRGVTKNAGSNPILTTLIKLVYEQPLRWDALIRMEVKCRKWYTKWCVKCGNGHNP